MEKIPKTLISLFFLVFATIYLWYGQISGKTFNISVNYMVSTFTNLIKYLNDEMQRNEVSTTLVSGDYLTKTIPYKLSYLSQISIFILITIGIIITIFYIYKRKKINLMYFYISASFFIVLLSILLIPFYGYDYTRVYLFALTILAPFYIVGYSFIIKRLKFSKKFAIPIISILIVVQFICSSGLIFYVSGVHQIQNHILYSQKDGTDWEYVHDSEIQSYNWINLVGTYDIIYGDQRVGATTFQYSRFMVRGDYFNLTKEFKYKGYIYLRYYNVVSRKVITTRSDAVGENINIFSNKIINNDKIYDNGGSNIYLIL